MKDVKVIVLRTAGTNCDKETVFAFELAGAKADLVHINEISRGEKKLDRYHILAIPGGFSYGDDISAGRVLAVEMMNKISAQVDKFVADGKLVIGICNGFQVLVKTGLLPGFNAGEAGSGAAKQSVTLFDNDSGKFDCRWVHLNPVEGNVCVFTQGIETPIYLPIAHGEGKLIFDNVKTRDKLRAAKQGVFQYSDASGKPGPYPVNPNGSEDDLAGICNATGRVFGLMPHPERHVLSTQHPRWTRGEASERGDGFAIFRNAVAFASMEL
jgi:phosphoribosylformylglycinamidine synthase